MSVDRRYTIVGLTLVELLLAIFLMSLVSLVLSQTFAVGTDAYHRGRRTLRGLGDARSASHAMVAAVRSIRPDTENIKLVPGVLGSTFSFLRRSRSGIEENTFSARADRGQTKLWFRRRWPVGDGTDNGGSPFPVARDISGFGVEFVLPDMRRSDRWPLRTTSSDTPPRLVEFKIHRGAGRVFESAAYIRADLESLTLAADTSTESDT